MGQRSVKLTIATITARAEPHYDWLVDDLIRQAAPDDELELVIVDCLGRSVDMLLPNLGDRLPQLRQIQIALPKPNPWQGPYRVTTRDLHGIANARNTALCLASHAYVAFLDDRARICPTWLAAVRRAQACEVAVCGPCDRDVREGRFYRQYDDRRKLSTAKASRPIPRPDWFYGGSFALPLAWALEINGCEEGTDPVGHQDRVMGHMLANRHRPIIYDPAMAILQDRKLPEVHPFPRIRNGGERRQIAKRYYGLKRTECTPDLAVIRAVVQRGEPFPMHHVKPTDLDLFSGQPIGEL